MLYFAGAAAPLKLAGQISMLRKAWESSARVTKDDWSEWMRHFSVELLAQSPSPALRACHSLAQVGIRPQSTHAQTS
jgi:FKBP12-rapamycin complex-associated protein